jgi:co-chaperonin GroES (HSP10)
VPELREEMTLLLRGDRVQVEGFFDDYRGSPLLSHSSIIIPDIAKEPSRLAKVVAIGDGRLQDGTQHVFSVKVGDLVLCQRYPKTGAGVKWHGNELFFMSETEILAKVENGEDC